MHQVKGDYHSKLSALIRTLAGMTGNLVKYANIANDLAQDDKTVKPKPDEPEPKSNLSFRTQ